MIRTRRGEVAPEILLVKGAEEQEKAKVALIAHKKVVEKALRENKKPPKFSYTFKYYKHPEVKDPLVRIFHGKCAYCESFYSSTQPMDVEHFRPKGAVAEDPAHPGYYWLAATWDNLLPSCIDCNRARKQKDVVEKTTLLLGKKDKFPVGGTRAQEPEDLLSAESAYLLDPSRDDPDQFLEFDTELGVVVPRHQTGEPHRRALESIEIYGLNRSGLVTDRLHILRMIDHHLRVVERLTKVRDGLDSEELKGLQQIVDEVITFELRAIFEMRNHDRPYAGMARQVIREVAPDLTPPPNDSE